MPEAAPERISRTGLLLERYAWFILRLARQFVAPARGAIEPGDVAHDVIASLLRKERAGLFDPTRIVNVEAFLYVTVRRAATRSRALARLAARRTERADLASISDESGNLGPESVRTPESVTRRGLDRRRTIEVLKARLHPRDALAFSLLVEDELDVEEVAERLGATANNVHQMRHRILAASRLHAAEESRVASRTADRTRITSRPTAPVPSARRAARAP